MSDNDNWLEWKNLILADLKQFKQLSVHLREDIEALERSQRAHMEEMERRILEKQHKIQIEVERLKIKSGVWGLLGGAIPAVVFVAMKVFG